MKKNLNLLIASLLVFSSPSFGASPKVRAGTFAPGISLGFKGAGSISLKYWLQEKIAFDINVEYFKGPFSVIYADAYYHFPEVFAKSSGHLRETALYVGAGLGAGAWHREDNCARFGCSWNEGTKGSGDGYFLRTVGGAEWYPPRTELGIFMELAPSYLLYPNTKIIYDLLAGARLYW